MAKAPHKSTQFAGLLVTFLALTSILGYYFLIYIPEKDGNIKKRYFRSLARIADNIQSKEATTLRVVRNNPNKLTLISEIDEEDSVGHDIDTTDHLIKAERDRLTYTIFLNKQRYHYQIPIKEFIDPILKKDVFEEYILINLSSKLIIYDPMPTGLQMDRPDTLLYNDTEYQNGAILDVNINGTDYVLFLLPHHITPNISLLIGGLKKKDEVNTEKYSISTFTLLIIFLIGFLLFLGIPFFKLLLMSHSERLSTRDVVFVYISLFLTTSLVTLILINVFTYVFLQGNDRTDQLEALSNEISQQFNSEIDDALRFLNVMEQQYDQIPDSTVNLIDALIKVFPDSNYYKIYPGLQFIYWMDKEGQQRKKIAAGTNITPMINLGDRPYFKNIKEGNFWYSDHVGDPFYLESVFSWNDGENIGVISKKSKIPANEVVALTTRLYSLINPLLPEGYGYAMIDEQGKVLFHSNKSLNLQENFIEECTKNTTLRAALFSNIPANFNSGYHGEDYKLRVTPILNGTLFLVTFEADKFIKNANAQIISITVIFLQAITLLVCLILFLQNLFHNLIEKFKIKGPSFEWLLPSINKSPIYKQLIVYNIYVILLMTVFFIILKDIDPLAVIILIVLSAVLQLYLAYFKLNDIRFSSFFNWLLCIKIFILLAVNVWAAVALPDNSYFLILLFQVLYGVGIWLLHRSSGIFPVIASTRYFRRSYEWSLLSWLALLSIAPAIMFYIISYNNEISLLIKHKQLHQLKALEEREHLIDRQYGFVTDTLDAVLNNLKKDLVLNKGVYSDFYYNNLISADAPHAYDSTQFNETPDVFSVLKFGLRPYFNDISVETNLLYSNKTSERNWEWVPSDTSIHLIASLKGEDEGYPYVLNITTEISPFSLKSVPLGLLFLLALFSMLMLMYAIMRFAIRKIYALNFFTNKSLLPFDLEFHNIKDLDKNIFLIKLPFSGEIKKWDIFYQNNHKDIIKSFSMVQEEALWNKELEKATKENYKVMVINHLDYNINDFDLNRKKLAFLEKLLLIKNKKIIITSSVHPLLLKEVYEGKIKHSGDSEIFRQDFDRWTNLLSNFYKIYYPLQGEGNKDAGKKPLKDYERFIRNECSQGKFLKKLEPYLLTFFKNRDYDEIDYRRIILKIQSMAQIHYFSLWTGCTMEEKYIIYDLAQDGLVNSSNTKAINILLNKGLLKFDGVLKIMNESFRHYVLTIIQPNEALLMEQEAVASGNWHKFRAPLFMVVIALALFLFITQEETFNNINAFLASLIAGVPIIFRLLSLTGLKTEKPEDRL